MQAHPFFLARVVGLLCAFALAPVTAGEPGKGKPAQALELEGDVLVTMTRGPGDCSGCSGGKSVAARVEGRAIHLALTGDCEGPCEALLRTNRQTLLQGLKPGRYEVFYDAAVFEFRLEALKPQPRECSRDSDCKVSGYDLDPCKCPPCARVKLRAVPVLPVPAAAGVPPASLARPACVRPTECPKCATLYEPENARPVCRGGTCALMTH